MPTTKKEELYFGLMMCTGMVIFMTTYNLITNDLIGKMTWIILMMQYVIGFIIAFILESFIVGPLAKKAVMSLPFDKSKKVMFIVSLAFCMVTGMVLCMSVYGLLSSYRSNGLAGESLLKSYFTIVMKNYVFALPLQLIVIGPLMRTLFSKFVKGSRADEAYAQS
ncbi:hypothetical protein [Paenibacillus dakarensis]|uniref:hypothetical protein n=1 Tax=Paenibacillus dakarensis TaxID=1527293 RepID=UPI0006D54DE0|nr:hypothetical protein [Paenibacillus dakarensis]